MNRGIEELVHAIVAAGLATSDQFQGCTADEVTGLERTFGLRFPDAYRDWLLAMGRGAGRFLSGSDAFYQDLPELRKSAEELLLEDGSDFPLPLDVFVFLVHQGYQFLCFSTATGEADPPVQYYFSGEWKDGWPRLTDYYFEVLDDQVRLGEA